MIGPVPLLPTNPAVVVALRDCKRAFWSVALFSAAVNILMFAGPLYMLQIYDRVLSSRSVPTLVALTVFLVGACAFQGAFDVLRGRVVVRAASLLDRNLAMTVHDAVVRISLLSRDGGEAHQPLRDLDQIRGFLNSPGALAIVDVPWVPVFLAICFLIHPWLGSLSLFGATLLFSLTILTEWASRAPGRMVSQQAGVRLAMIEADRRNSETSTAMGMTGTLAQRWVEVNDRYLSAVARSADITGSSSSVTKVLRLLLQSAILGLGSYLVINQELSAGAMIAASIMMGRALAPIEVAVGHWRLFLAARQSVARLSQTWARFRLTPVTTKLPKPSRSLEVAQLVVSPPKGPAAVVANVHFQLTAGEAVGIVGPSGAGKTSLVRTVVGIWPPLRGKIRLDGAALDQWNPEALGRHIGYLSQTIELFDGTIAENIARMDAEPDSIAVLQAARTAGAHEMILRLPQGYETRIGDAGAALSAGQRQRIALARALYGDPFLVALDEPNSNLDNEGELALQQAIRSLKARGAIVLLIAHRPAALSECNKVLVLAQGIQQAFGPRDEVLQRATRTPPVAPPAAGNLKVVSDSAAGGER